MHSRGSDAHDDPRSRHFTIAVSRCGHAAASLQVRGELDTHTGRELAEVVRDLLAEAPSFLIVVDLSELNFIDRAGLMIVDELVGIIDRPGDDVAAVLIRPGAAVRRVRALLGSSAGRHGTPFGPTSTERGLPLADPRSA